MGTIPGQFSFSVDVDAHLQKLAAYAYRSPHYYLIELIRTARKRRATQIDIILDENSVKIIDNGCGIDRSTLDQLIDIANRQTSSLAREFSINRFHRHQSIGLLAVFTPNPDRIVIENHTRQEKTILDIGQKREARISQTANISPGTCLTLYRKKKNWVEEVTLINEYCPELAAALTVNKQPIKKHSLLRHCFIKIGQSLPGGKKDAWVGIPFDGEVCQIWLTDEGIPWHFKTLPRQQGMIFAAVIESSQYPDEEKMGLLANASLYLYEWMTKKCQEYPLKYRQRIEDLIFTYCSLTHDFSLIDRFPVFKSADRQRAFTLEQLLTLSPATPIYTINERDHPKNYNTFNKLVLSLTNRQIEFLQEQNIPLTFILPIRQSWPILSWIKHKILNRLKPLLFRPWPAIENKALESEISPGERHFLKQIDQYYQKKNQPGGEYKPDVDKKIVLTKQKGFFPCFDYWPAKTTEFIIIRRDHPKMQKIIDWVAKNPDTIEIVLPFILY